MVDTLVFGSERAGAEPVTSEQFRTFLAQEVTPRFPEGLTAWDAAGEWRTPTGRMLSEASHVVMLVHGADAASDTLVREIIARYEHAFGQQSVLRVRTRSCVSF